MQQREAEESIQKVIRWASFLKDKILEFVSSFILNTFRRKKMKSRISLIFFLCIVSWLSVTFTTAAQAEGKPEILSIAPGKVARGEMITITGKNLSKEDVGTIVTIDGVKSQYVELDSAEKIKVRVDTAPKPELKKRAGEYSRTVIVAVGEQQSDKYTISQLTWGAVLQPQVLLVLGLYLAVVAYFVFGVKASLFKSKTGKLSLSKIQMGLWTFFFGLSYVLLAAIWRQFLDVTEGMFWLMGISSATAVGAKAIVLKNKIDPNAPNPSTLFKDYDEKAKEYRLSLHRCQIALWTLIVLSIYIVKCIGTMHLPEIPEKLLILMGVSGGTYLGFNYPKSK
jgi:hypothetical protein